MDGHRSERAEAEIVGQIPLACAVEVAGSVGRLAGIGEVGESKAAVVKLAYATVEVKRGARVFGPTAYALAVLWSGVLAVVLILTVISDSRFSLRAAEAMTVGTSVVALGLLRILGRVGCVTLFLVYSFIALAILWLA